MQESWKNDLLNKDPKVRKRTVIAMAESRDPDALKILKFLHEKDADPQIRELAKKAGTHLWKTLQEQKVSAAPTQKIKKQHIPAAPQPQVKPQTPPAKAPASSAPTKRPTPPAKASAVPAAPVSPAKVPAPPAEAPATSAPTQRPAPSPAPTPKPARPVQAKPEPLPKDAFDLPDPQTEMYLDDDENAIPHVDVNSKQIATARIHVARATALVVKGNKNDALRYLQNACQINPELQKEELVLNLAGELTGLPRNEALKSIMSMKGASATQNIGTPNRTLLYIGIGVGVVIVIAILAIFVF